MMIHPLGILLGVPGPGGGSVFGGLAITTTGAQTATIHALTVATGKTVTVNWGDGSSTTYTAGAGARTHAYAGAGTWTVTFSNPGAITALDIRSTGLFTAFNSAELLKCPALTSLSLTLGAVGTWTFNSAHISAMVLTSLYLFLSASVGTYAFNSAHISAMVLTSLTLTLSAVGTYAFNSAHIATLTTITNITVVLNTTTLTTTIAQADWDGFPACGTIRFEAGLAQAKVDAILLGFYDGFAAKTVVNGTIDLLGTSNAAPSGVLQAQCPPTTGLEACFELANDSCGVSTKHWAAVTTA